jgi:hypothetical protein
MILITIISTLVAVFAIQKFTVWLVVGVTLAPYPSETWLHRLSFRAYELCELLGWALPESERSEVEGLDRYPEDGSDPRIQFITRIVVPSEYARDQVVKAIRYLHDSDIDTEYMAVNWLVHAYTGYDGEPTDYPPAIVVEPEIDGPDQRSIS